MACVGWSDLEVWGHVCSCLLLFLGRGEPGCEGKEMGKEETCTCLCLSCMDDLHCGNKIVTLTGLEEARRAADRVQGGVEINLLSMPLSLAGCSLVLGQLLLDCARLALSIVWMPLSRQGNRKRRIWIKSHLCLLFRGWRN